MSPTQQSSLQLPAPGGGRVVHLAGRVTDEVFSFLGPATATLAQSGIEQTVVMIDDARFRRLLANFHGTVQLVLTGAERNPIRHWRRSLGAFRHAVHAKPLRAVHLHGLVAGLTGAHVARGVGIDASFHYWVHSPLFRAGRFGPLWQRTAQRFGGGAAHRFAFANLADSSLLDALTRESVGRMESPIAALYFVQPREEARYPLVVTGSRDGRPRHAEVFAQLAVLLGGADLELAFNWIGNVDEISCQCLQAANVGIVDAKDEHERALRLAAGWVYLAPDGMRGFPLCLVQAMASGLPCVAVDIPYHRNVIRHGETGYLCGSRHQMLDAVAELIDTPALRRRIGDAARHETQRRFSAPMLRDSLLAAYDQK